MILSNMTTYEPPRDKTNKITVRLAKTQISLGIRPVWSVRLMGSQGSSANKMTVRLAKTQINLMGSQGSSASWCGQRRLIRLGGVFAGRTWHFVGFCHEAACMTSVCSFNHGYKCMMMQGLRLVFALLIVLLKYPGILRSKHIILTLRHFVYKYQKSCLTGCLLDLSKKTSDCRLKRRAKTCPPHLFVWPYMWL